MTKYIKDFVSVMLNGRMIEDYFQVLAQELDRLDPRDFYPDAQGAFITLRAETQFSFRTMDSRFEPITTQLKQLVQILDMYRGKGSRGVQRSFPYLHDAALQNIVERDYIELSVILFPSGAWKSCVIMAGSILEAILSDVLSAPTRIAATMASPKKPPKGDLLKGEWKLEKLIEVATDTNILPAARADSIDQVLRDYRNFVHAKKEIRSQHECTEAEGLLAKGALDGVCNHLEKIF